MQNFSSVEQVLNFAIENEQQAYEFYTDLAAKVNNPQLKGLFESFANEELGHKSKLEGVKKGQVELMPSDRKITDMKIADYAVHSEPVPELTFQSSLVLAMNKEKAAFKLYSELAAAAQQPDLKAIFTALANEEAKHKLHFEIMYDDEIMREN